MDATLAIEFGINDRLYHRIEGGFTSARAAEHRAELAAGTPATQASKEAWKKANPEAAARMKATDELRAATKNGKISEAERTAFEKSPRSEVLDAEEKRLAAAVHRATGDSSSRDKDGVLKTNTLGTPAGLGAGIVNTEHKKLVQKLKTTEGVKELKDAVASLKKSGASEETIKQAQSKLDTRIADEAKVAAVVKDKQAYAAVLELQKSRASSASSESAKDDYQQLRQKAVTALETFKANGGKVHDPQLIGDDWRGKDDLDFDKMVDIFHKNGELKNWAAHQGNANDGFYSREDMEKHAREQSSSTETARIMARYGAAKELESIMQQYEEARSTVDGADGRAKAIDGEIALVNKSLDDDMSVISDDVKTKQLTAADATASELGINEVTPGGELGNHSSSGDDHRSVGGSEGDPNTVANTDPQNPPTKQLVPVDFSAPEVRAEIMKEAQAKGLLPKEHVTFAQDGTARYEVQRGDSYWRIAQNSSGSDGFDAKHFKQLMKSNVERLDREDNPPLIYDGEKIELTGRSIDDLVRLLNLDTHVEVELEESDEVSAVTPEPIVPCTEENPFGDPEVAARLEAEKAQQESAPVEEEPANPFPLADPTAELFLSAS